MEGGEGKKGGGKAISDLLEGGGEEAKLFTEKFRVGSSLRYISRVVQFAQRGKTVKK